MARTLQRAAKVPMADTASDPAFRDAVLKKIKQAEGQDRVKEIDGLADDTDELRGRHLTPGVVSAPAAHSSGCTTRYTAHGHSVHGIGGDDHRAPEARLALGVRWRGASEESRSARCAQPWVQAPNIVEDLQGARHLPGGDAGGEDQIVSPKRLDAV